MEGQPTSTQNFKFEGRDGEFFKIWIVNLLLSIATLGIYSAWAKVRVERYFYGNTFFDGSNFEYHATGWQIFKGRIIAVIALAIYIAASNLHPASGIVVIVLLALATPWILWSSYRFKARVSSYRGVRFMFVGELKKAYWVLLLIPFGPAVIFAALAYLAYFFEFGTAMGAFISLAVFSFYVAIPYVQARLQEYHANGMRYGQGEFSTKVSIWLFYKTYLQILLAILGIGIVIAIVSALMGAGSFFMAMASGNAEAFAGLFSIFIFLFYFVIFFISFWAKAFMETRISNHVLSNLTLDKTVSFHSSLKTMQLTGLLFTNWLILVFTFGLGYPIAAIRLAQYRAKCLEGTIHSDLNHYVNQQQQKQSALGEELGGAFDIQGDLGLSL
jgi:uncharacterized membrane protein YjgN (DUF898 family)